MQTKHYYYSKTLKAETSTTVMKLSGIQSPERDRNFGVDAVLFVAMLHYNLLYPTKDR